MLAWLSRRVVKDAWYVVGTWAAVALVLLSVLLTGLGGKGVLDAFGRTTSTVSGTESAEGEAVLSALRGDSRTVTLLVTGIDISSAQTQEAVAEALAEAHADLRMLVGEQYVLDPFVVPGMLEEPAAQAMASSELDGFLIIVTVNPNGTQVADPADTAYAAEVQRLVDKVELRLRQVPGELEGISPTVAGVVSEEGLIDAALTERATADLVIGLMIAVPVALLVLVLVLGGFVLAEVPMLGGLTATAASMTGLLVLTRAVEVQSFVVVFLIMVALALSLAFGLLITMRYREELAAPHAEQVVEVAGRRRRPRSGRRDPHVGTSMITTVSEAGRTVWFAGLVVAAPFVGLALMGSEVLVVIGLGGLVVVAASVSVALTLVPAVLVLLGRRLLRPTLLQRLGAPLARRRVPATAVPQRSVFTWLAMPVKTMPWLVLVACVAILVVMASPARHLHTLVSSTDLLSADNEQRTYEQILAANYPAPAHPDATLIISSTGEKVTTFINEQVAAVNGVTAVTQSSIAGEYTVVFLDLDGDGSTPAAVEAVKDIRALPAPADLWVTGQASSQYDMLSVIRSSLPIAIGVTVLMSLVAMFLLTGSFLLPLKAMLINVVVLAATLGVLVWVVQEGRLAGALGLSTAAGLETSVMVTVVAVAYGLAMCGEAFVLARIKEQFDAGAQHDEAVLLGLQHSGRVVTSAALVMMASFASFLSGELRSTQQLALALAVVVALDTTLVRLLLVPASLALLGGWSWWLPTRLRPLRERYGLEQETRPGARYPGRPTAHPPGAEPAPAPVEAVT